MQFARTILIVGGTSGLGRKLVELYSLNNYKIGVIGRRAELLDEITNENLGQIFSLQLDISSSSCFEKLNAFIESLGGIDILVLSASVVEFNPNISLDLEKATLATNVDGYTNVLNCAYHYFRRRNKGHIAVITSTASARGNKTAPAYNASKAFQSSYIEGIRLKLAEQNADVCVTEIIPGYMDTRMAKGDRLFWVTDILKAAKQTKKAIDSKKRKAFVSKRWALVFYIYKFIPSFLYQRLINSKIRFSSKS